MLLVLDLSRVNPADIHALLEELHDGWEVVCLAAERAYDLRLTVADILDLLPKLILFVLSPGNQRVQIEYTLIVVWLIDQAQTALFTDDAA